MDYEADVAYERYLETRYTMEPEEQADFNRHCEAWPNGYGVCPEPYCSLGVYHPGEHEAFREASELGWPAGRWERSFDFFGLKVFARFQRRDPEGELLGVLYLSADGFRLFVAND